MDCNTYQTKRIFIFHAFATLVFFLSSNVANADGDDWIKKDIGADWTWFTDYAFLYSNYVLICEPGCQCEVGMGIKALGTPRGEKVTFTQDIEIFTIGVGAIHIRSTGKERECKAAMQIGDYSTVNILSVHW